MNYSLLILALTFFVAASLLFKDALVGFLVTTVSIAVLYGVWLTAVVFAAL